MYLPRNLYNRILTLGGVLLVVAFSGCLGGAMAADENKEAAAVRARLKAIVYHLAGTIGPRSHKGGGQPRRRGRFYHWVIGIVWLYSDTSDL